MRKFFDLLVAFFKRYRFAVIIVIGAIFIIGGILGLVFDSNKYKAPTEVIAIEVPVEATKEIVPLEKTTKAEKVVVPEVVKTPKVVESVTTTTSKAVESVSVAPSVEPLMDEIYYQGQRVASVTAYDGHATIEYPTNITKSDVEQAIAAALSAYPEYLNFVTYSLPSSGKAELTYPKGYTKEDFEYALYLIEAELPYYLDSLTKAEVVLEEPIKVEPVKEELILEKVEPYHKVLNYGPYSATITATEGKATIEYPSWITDEEFMAASQAALIAYPGYLDNITYTLKGNGRAEVTYPETITTSDLELASRVLEQDLPFYIASLAPKQEVKEVVAKVAEKEVVVAPIVVEEEKSEKVEPSHVVVQENTPVIEKEEIVEPVKATLPSNKLGLSVGLKAGWNLNFFKLEKPQELYENYMQNGFSFGFALHYEFTKAWGLNLDTTFNLLNASQFKNSTISWTKDETKYESYEFFLGPSYTYHINEKFKLRVAVGLDLGLLKINSQAFNYSLGVAGQVQAIWNIGDFELSTGLRYGVGLTNNWANNSLPVGSFYSLPMNVNMWVGFSCRF